MVSAAVLLIAFHLQPQSSANSQAASLKLFAGIICPSSAHKLF